MYSRLSNFVASQGLKSSNETGNEIVRMHAVYIPDKATCTRNGINFFIFFSVCACASNGHGL